MPAYAALADLIAAIPRGEQELIELTDRTGSGEVDEARVDGALLTATSVADSYLSRVVAVPLTTVPPLLNTHVCNIARYQLWGDRPIDEVLARYRDAITWLKDVAAGRADLGLPPEAGEQLVSRASRGEIRSGYNWSGYPL